MAEVKVRLVTQSHSEGAERMRSDLEAAKTGAVELNDVLGGTADAHEAVAAQAQAASQITQAALEDVKKTAETLSQTLKTLPEDLQRGFAEFVRSLERLDVMGAIERKGRMHGVPDAVQHQMREMIGQVAAVAPPTPLAEPIRTHAPATTGDAPPTNPPTYATPTGEAPEDRRAGGMEVILERLATVRQREENPKNPTATLRRAFTALQEGDPDTARDHQRTAARAALQSGDNEALETATTLTVALRQHGDRDNGVQSQRRYQATLKRLETRLQAAEESAETDAPGGPKLASKTALGRAERTLSTVDATLQGGISRPSELHEVETRLGKARAYLQQAERGGAPDRALEDLREQLEALTKTLEETREAYKQGGNVPNGPRLPDDGGGGNGIPPALLDELKRLGGGGLAQLGPAGRMLSRLGPAGMAAGAVVAAGGLAQRLVSGPNLQARESYGASVDLARLYGHEDTDPMDLFRNRRTGLSDDDLIDRGWTATDASRVMAQLDTPDAGAVATVREDALDVLDLSRSTGLDEGQLTSALQSLRHTGVYAPGEAQDPLETVKLALTEAVRNGVSQADTLRNLVALTEEGLMQGRSLTPEALAFQAALQAQLAGTGNAALKGDAGATVQDDLNALVTGEDDIAMKMLMVPVVKDLTPEDLGLEGEAAEGMRKLAAHDPMAANFAKIDLLRDGRNPEIMAQLAERLEAAAGDNVSLLSAMLEHGNIRGEAQLEVLGGGLGNIYRSAADDAPRFLEGEALDSDAQGGNDLDARSRAVLARERDERESKGWGTLSAFGDVGELSNRGQRAGSAATRGVFSIAGSYDNINQGVIDERGSLRGGGTPSEEPDAG